MDGPPATSQPRAEVRRHPLIFGDWCRPVRDGIDLLRLGFVAAAVATAVAGDWALCVTATFGFLVAMLGRVAELPRPFDLALMVGIGLHVMGHAADLYETTAWYDSVVHLFLPLALAPALYLVLARLGVVPDLAEEVRARQRFGMGLITGAMGLSVGVLFELLEFVLDNYLGMTLDVGYADTVGDLLVDAVGGIGGAALLVLWATHGWGTQRRARGDG